jgi:uncharacterized protein (DUF1810 family)
VECTQAVPAGSGRSIADIFGYPDDLKLKSSMTLFATVAGADSTFARLLDQYFHGERDQRTIQLLAQAAS